ncbi:MAG: DUF4105 domain-containing protein [Gemmatimonadales bacterium]
MSLLLALALGLGTQGQQSAPPGLEPGDSARGAALTVYLLTFDPGEAAWERFGHNAIWISDPVAGTDIAYDYGRFSFRESNFVLRFAQGRLRYWMGSGDVRLYVGQYRAAGRRIWRQELRLEPAARAELQRFLEWNVQPENRYYRYDYYLDNCSTRIRDAIDRATGGAVRRYATARPASMTFRQHTRRTTENNPFLYSALMMGLGQPVDEPITAWDEMFLPIELRPYLDSIQVAGPNGALVPLVASEAIVVASDRFGVAARPSPWLPRYLGVGLAIGLTLYLSGRARRRSGVARRVFLWLGVSWSAVAGIAGALLLFLWALTDHQFSVRNENLLQANVLSLWLAGALPAAARAAPGERPVGGRLAAILVGLAAAGLALKALPIADQRNLDMIALILPIHLGLWQGLTRARG